MFEKIENNKNQIPHQSRYYTLLILTDKSKLANAEKMLNLGIKKSKQL